MGEKVRKSFQIEQSGKTLLQKHIETATEAQSSYQNEKVRVVPSNEMAVALDMQIVIMLPRLPALKQTIFCKRFALSNETFTPIGNS